MLYELLEWNFCNRWCSIAERLAYISVVFLGKPYVLNALGEGDEGEFNQNPRYRWDAFDCVTYVNTMLALLASVNPIEFHYHMAFLNYRSGIVKFEKRHHFMSVDWNIANAEYGYVRDITPEIEDNYGNPLCCYASTYIDKPNWFKQRSLSDLKINAQLSEVQLNAKLAQLKKTSEKISGIQACTPYLALKNIFNSDGEIFFEIKMQLPKAMIVEIIRPNWNLVKQIGTNLNVSHVGFLLEVQDQLIFRHASQEQKKVVDQPLELYLYRYLQSPTVKGINLQQILPKLKNES